MESLLGKTALVTGASYGIGRAIAVGYAKLGMQVVVVARTLCELELLAAEINQQTQGKAIAVAADVGIYQELDRAFKSGFEEFGSFDVVVANAGVNQRQGNVRNLELQSISTALSTNILGCINTFKCALNYIDEAHGASLISIGSGIGHSGAANNAIYAATKGATWAFTKSLGLELADTNICVNELIPGPVKTRMNPNASGPSWKEPADIIPMAVELARYRAKNMPTAQSFSLMRR